jgi:hypothetical protein
MFIVTRVGFLVVDVEHQYGYELYDFTDGAKAGVSDDEMADGIHTADTACLKMYIRMLEQGSALRMISDMGELKEILAKSNRFTTKGDM